jgi:CheY-like chemotaxis protein
MLVFKQNAQALRILVADDVETNRLVARAILERHGHHVDTVANGMEASEHAARGGYDLVLMDVDMPVMDGISATQAIRASRSPGAAVPIVALTSRSDDRTRQLAQSAGMSGFITKPLRSETVLTTLATLTTARDDDRELPARFTASSAVTALQAF